MDPKPTPRVRDKELLRELHLRWLECVICGSTSPLSLHHVNKHPRDDLEANLVMLCGSGTTGCHGLIEAADPITCWSLAYYIHDNRQDILMYLEWRFPQEGGQAWLRRVLGV